MTAPVDAQGYHVGIVVADAAAATDRYRALFGGVSATFDYVKPASRLAEHPWPSSAIRISYCRTMAMTLELIQPLDDAGPYAAFLARHGEGVHHLGCWVPDLPAAVEQALLHGARLTSATITAPGTAAVSVAMPPGDLARLVVPPAAFVDAGAGPEIELVGASAIEALERLLGDAVDEIVERPQWR